MFLIFKLNQQISDLKTQLSQSWNTRGEDIVNKVKLHINKKSLPSNFKDN